MFYALGEIVLVVIGILIALQINTWNIENQNNKRGIVYLNDLQLDIQRDTITLNDFILSNELKLAAFDSIAMVLENKDVLSDAELVRFLGHNQLLCYESYFIPEKSAITQIRSTGEGDLIANKELRDAIFRYYGSNERLELDIEKSIQLYQHNFISKNIVKTVFLGAEASQITFKSTLGRSKFDLNAVRQDSDYLTALGIKNESVATQNKNYKVILADAEEILKLIEAELNTRK